MMMMMTMMMMMMMTMATMPVKVFDLNRVRKKHLIKIKLRIVNASTFFFRMVVLFFGKLKLSQSLVKRGLSNTIYKTSYCLESHRSDI